MTLIPVVVQDAISGRVLMLAWANDEALALTASTGLAHFWSRSRQKLWKKGETSGNVLRVVESKRDCDSDTVLLRCLPAGPTCHTGSVSCFGADGSEPAAHALEALEQTIRARLAAPAGTRSYVRTLIEGDRSLVRAKILEEAQELADELAAAQIDRARVVSEAADVWFHAMVGLAAAGVSFAEVLAELHRRAGRSGLDEKAARNKP